MDERRNQRIGAITITVIGAAILFFLFVYDRIELGSPTRIRVYFHHSAALREHAALVVGGRAVGRIESIDSVLHDDASPLHGATGTVATVAIDDDAVWKVPANAEIFVASHGMFSEKYLEVAPPRGPDAAERTPVHEGSELVGVDPPSLDNVLGSTWARMVLLRAFVDDVRPDLASLQHEVELLRAHLADTAADVEAALPAGLFGLATETRALLAEARTIYATGLGGEAGVTELRATLTSARQTLALARTALDRLAPLAGALGADVTRVRDRLSASDPPARLDAVLATARASLDRLDPLLAKLEDVSGRLARGEGSLGRLMKDPEFPEDAKELGKIMKRQPWRIIARPKD